MGRQVTQSVELQIIDVEVRGLKPTVDTWCYGGSHGARAHQVATQKFPE